jgi:2-hydroxychromene-2-carboxylate isomerase
VKQKLQDTTDELVQKGGFGVPSYYIPSIKRLFFGSDRLHFVEKALGNYLSALPRFYSQTPSSKHNLRFYFDFSSPWAYIGFTQLQKIAKETNCQIEFFPILLGALFREIGTPNVPLLTLIEPKRNYQSLDMKDWCDWWGIQLNWPSTFPIRSVLALRLAIVEPQLIPILFKAAWVDNKNISDTSVVAKLLEDKKIPLSLLKDAESQQVKEKLKDNTDKAKNRGLCGRRVFKE